MLLVLSIAVLVLCAQGCQLPSEWRPLSEGCRSELAEIIIYARVLALHREPMYNSLGYGFPFEYGGSEPEDQDQLGLLYSAEVELLCDQAWGSMLEVPAGSRLNLTGLGYLSCQSHTVLQENSYIFFLRMDDNYNLLPHAVNFQDAVFPDTAENRRTFSSLFQFSNCSHGAGLAVHSPEWEQQEDSQLLCSSVQGALFEEEERGRMLQERLAAAERRNRQLKERVRKVKHSLRSARNATRRAQQEARELQVKLRGAERLAGRHLNVITQEEPLPPPPPSHRRRGRYGTELRPRTPL